MAAMLMDDNYETQNSRSVRGTLCVVFLFLTIKGKAQFKGEIIIASVMVGC